MQDKQVIISPHQFRAPKVMQVKQGASIRMIVDQMYSGIPQTYRDYNVLVEINGEPIDRDRWNIIPSTDDHVLIYVPVHGGGGNGGKNPLRTILTVIVAIVAIVVTIYFPYVSGLGYAALAGEISAGFASTASALAGLAVGTLGSLAINALFPISGAPSSLGQQAGNVFGYSGTSNRFIPWGPIPVILGTHKMFPPLGARPYTEISGKNEILRMLFVWGEGPLKIEDIKIGETPISSFIGVTIETREGWPDDEPITLIPSIVYQDQIGVQLKNSDGRVVRSAKPNVDELSVDVQCPYGLCAYTPDNYRLSRKVSIRLEQRELPAGEWEIVTEIADVRYNGTSKPAIAITPDTLVSIYVDTGGAFTYVAGEEEIAGKYRIGTAYYTSDPGILVVFNLSPEGVSGFTCSGVGNSDIVVTGGTIFGVEREPFRPIEDNSVNPVRRGHRWTVDRTKSYEIGLTRLTDDYTLTQIIDRTYWYTLRGLVSEHPVSYPKPLAMTAIRIRMSEQLQGVIDTLSGTVSSYAEVWDGDEWGGSAVTKNPAALMRLVLKHQSNAKTRGDEHLDDAVFGEFYEFCESNGYEFNMVRDGVTSIWETLSNIAAAGRGAPTLIDGRWGVIWDDNAAAPVVQHITPRNSWGFTSEKILYRPPHALRVAFKNEDNNYQDDEIIVYDDGYNASNATVFESLELPGITNASLVWKFTRYQMAQARLRPEAFQVNMDFEHLVFRRGSKVLVSHDVPMWGGYTGRVKTVNSLSDTASGTVTLSNTRLSAVNGTAFVDFSTEDVLTDYVPYRGKLTITDSAGKKLTGYIKAQGTGETYGSELVTNGDFATGDGTGWIELGTGVATEDYTGNELTSTITTAGSKIYGQAFVHPLKLLSFSVTVRDHNYQSLTCFFQRAPGSPGGTYVSHATLSTNGTFTGKFTAYSQIEHFYLGARATVALDAVITYDDVSIKQILTPSTTGITITSTPNGSTYNWASQESGFNYNDASGYTYEINYEDESGNPRIGGVTLDEEVAMEAGKLYACRFRRASEGEESIVLSVNTVAGRTKNLTFAAESGIPLADAPSVDDLAMFGEAERTAVECLVKDIARTDDLTAKVTFVDLAPAIYEADQGVIPAYDSQITLPPLERTPPAMPIIERVDSGTSALTTSGSAILSRIMVHIVPSGGYVPIGHHRFRFRHSESEQWDYVEIPAESTVAVYNDVLDGQSYLIQAQSVSRWGIASDWTEAITELVVGQNEPPSDVTGFRCNIIGSDAYLSWSANPVTDIDLSHYRIRYTPDKASPTWNSSVDIVLKIGTPTTSVAVPAMVGSYLIKAVDRKGNESENAAVVITTIARLSGINFVESIDLPTWLGDEDGLVYDSGLDALVLDVVDGAMLEEGYYDITEYIDLGDVYTARVTAQIAVIEVDINDDLYDVADLYELTNLYGGTGGDTNVSLEISLTDDDPEDDPTWTDYQPLIIGDYAARAFRFRIYGKGTLPGITPVISAVSIEIDMEDRVVSFEEEVPIDGTRIAFDPPFYVAPEIGIAVINGQEGDYYEITNKDETGFDIEFFNNSSSVARTITGIAKAYGSKEV